MKQHYTIHTGPSANLLILRRYRNGNLFHGISDKKEYIEGYARGLEENGWERWTELEEMEQMELEVQKAKEKYTELFYKLREAKIHIEAVKYRWEFEDEIERKMKEGSK